MKIKHIVLSASILVSVSAFAQKDELKALKKIYAKDEIKANDLVEYKGLVAKVEPLATEEGDKIYTGFYKSMIPVLEYLALDKTMSPAQIQTAVAKFVSPKSIADLAVGLNATLDYEKKIGKKVYTDDIKETIVSFKPQMLDYARVLASAKKDKEASDVIYSIYQLDTKDQDMLFYAASYAVQAQDFNKALDYYKELKRLNYTGEGTLYYAVNNKTKEEENLGNKVLRDAAIAAGSHSKPRDEKLNSKAKEISKNIALILIQQDKLDEAKVAIVDARKDSPDDSSLILSEANIYYKQNDMATYTKLISEALEKDPNNVSLLFNLGVTSTNVNKFDEAEKYYRKVIEIDPNYTNGYINLVDLLLKPDAKIVGEMTKLGTTEKDNKRYDVLKAQRQKLFNAVLPLLEKAHQLDPKNNDIKGNLKLVYNFLELTDKLKALKAEE